MRLLSREAEAAPGAVRLVGGADGQRVLAGLVGAAGDAAAVGEIRRRGSGDGAAEQSGAQTDGGTDQQTKDDALHGTPPEMYSAVTLHPHSRAGNGSSGLGMKTDAVMRLTGFSPRKITICDGAEAP